MHSMTRLLSLSALLLLPAIGCDPGDPAGNSSTPGTETARPEVFAINLALQSFATTIGGDLVEVEVPQLDGQPATSFKPTTEEIIGIQDAGLILLNGAEFSPWISQSSLPASKIVVTAAGFKSRWLESSHHHGHDHDHQHGPDGDGVHSHAHWASFTWLNPTNAQAQAEAVGQRMGQLLPEHRSEVLARATELVVSFEPLIEQATRIKAMSPPTMIASEPQYQYLAEACGLELLEADWHWGEPEPHDGLDSLRNLAKASGARHLIVPSAPDAERLATLQAMGLEPVVIPLLVTPDTDGGRTFVERLGTNLSRIESLAPTQPAG